MSHTYAARRVGSPMNMVATETHRDGCLMDARRTAPNAVPWKSLQTHGQPAVMLQQGGCRPDAGEFHQDKILQSAAAASGLSAHRWRVDRAAEGQCAARRPPRGHKSLAGRPPRRPFSRTLPGEGSELLASARLSHRRVLASSRTCSASAGVLRGVLCDPYSRGWTAPTGRHWQASAHGSPQPRRRPGSSVREWILQSAAAASGLAAHRCPNGPRRTWAVRSPAAAAGAQSLVG